MKAIMLCCVLVLALHGECGANSAGVAWDPVTLNTNGTPCTDLEGYRLFMGTSGGTYLNTFDVGMAQGTIVPCTTDPTPGCVRREFTVSGLPPDTYYFVLTAYDTSGNESDLSNEVSVSFASDATLPGDVLSFTATPYSTGARLFWTNPADQDLAQVVLKYSYNNGVYVTLDMMKAVPGENQSYDHLNLMAGTYTYAMHTKDTSGNMTHTAHTETAIGNTPQPAPNASGGGGGCFIATAAYGSYLDPHVMVLRQFRDDHLLTNRPGRAFVAVYYYTAPTIADFIAKHEWAREATQVALAPIVFTVLRPLEAVIFFTLLTLISIGMAFVIKRTS